MTAQMKQLLGKAGYKDLLLYQRKTVRSILRTDRELSQWYKTPGSLSAKLRALFRFLSYRRNISGKLTQKDIRIATMRLTSRHDYVDFIRNRSKYPKIR